MPLHAFHSLCVQEELDLFETYAFVIVLGEALCVGAHNRAIGSTVMAGTAEHPPMDG